jgi:hypothetical protein
MFLITLKTATRGNGSTSAGRVPRPCRSRRAARPTHYLRAGPGTNRNPPPAQARGFCSSGRSSHAVLPVLFALTLYDAPGRGIITARITDSDRIFHQLYRNLHPGGGSLVRIGRQGLGQTTAPGPCKEAGRCYLTADRYGIWPSLNTAFFSVSTTYTSPVLVTARPVGRTRVVVPAVFLLPSSLPLLSNL